MARFRKMLLPVALLAAALHGTIITGCGGGSSPSTPSGSAEVRMKFGGPQAARVAVAGARSASVAGAQVFVDGVVVGVTDANGEIVLQLAPGTHTITVAAGGVTSKAFKVTVAEGDVVTLEVEMEPDGTLVVDKDIDHDGDYDQDDDADDDDDHDGDKNGGDDDNGDDDTDDADEGANAK
ncbi:MAG TPA: carboxypeptidase regulatory-like domain-containing protein [bacterium]